MSGSTALLLTCQLLAVLSLIQSFEFLILRKYLSDQGVWRWRDLAPEMTGNNSFLAKIFSLFFSAKAFSFWQWLRIACALMLFFQPRLEIVLVLLFVHVLGLFRFRGSFNGGSDALTLIVFIGTSFSLAMAESRWAAGGLWYIAFQLCFSYAKAGWTKLRQRTWRQGQALGTFIASPKYQSTSVTRLLASSPRILLISSWALMLFELSFPLALLSPNGAWAYTGLGFLFHLANVYTFSLNRFLWAWLAAYPALLFTAASLHRL